MFSSGAQAAGTRLPGHAPSISACPIRELDGGVASRRERARPPGLIKTSTEPGERERARGCRRAPGVRPRDAPGRARAGAPSSSLS